MEIGKWSVKEYNNKQLREWKNNDKILDYSNDRVWIELWKFLNEEIKEELQYKYKSVNKILLGIGVSFKIILVKISGRYLVSVLV